MHERQCLDRHQTLLALFPNSRKMETVDVHHTLFQVVQNGGSGSGRAVICKKKKIQREIEQGKKEKKKRTMMEFLPKLVSAFHLL